MNRTNEEKILDILAGMQSSMLGMNKRMDSMENGILKLNIWKETEYEAKHQALLDGQTAILERLVPVSRVDELENRVKFLETMLRVMSEEVQGLKKAQ